MRFILVTGGCKNGKSAIAEKIICSYPVKRFYIATMEPFGDEARSAIERHRKIREGNNFTTIEKYTNIADINIPSESGVLLECVGNLLANEMFSAECKVPAEKIFSDMKQLIGNTEILVAVTSQVGSDGCSYSAETMDYMRELGLLNSKLAEIADTIIEAVFGIPVPLKGELPLCLC